MHRVQAGKLEVEMARHDWAPIPKFKAGGIIPPAFFSAHRFRPMLTTPSLKAENGVQVPVIGRFSRTARETEK
jgi:hypothetical protein